MSITMRSVLLRPGIAWRGPCDTFSVLSRIDPRNDGQLLAEDEIIPGGTLLGYANAGHWAVALRVENTMPFWAHRTRACPPYPQDTLLESALLHAQADLSTQQSQNSGLDR